MRTVILGERPPEIERLIAHRRATGADTHDEIWEGAYHMSPAPRSRHGLLEVRLTVLLHPPSTRAGLVVSGPFNLGRADDYRVPDLGIRTDADDVTFVSTAALAVEIVSPGDESWEKLPFYAVHGVDEVVIAEPADRSLVWMRLDAGDYRRIDRSELLDVAVEDIAAAIDWPPVLETA